MLYRNSFFRFVAIGLLFVAAFNSAESEAQKKSKKDKVFKNRYVVDLAALHDSDNVTLTRRGTKVLRNLGTEKFKNFKLISSDRNDSEARVAQVVDVQEDDQFCIDLIKAGLVKYCSPDFEVRISDTMPNDPGILPNNPGLPWGLNSAQGINAPSAWDVSRGSSEVVVAVIDTGVDYNHSDLSDNIWTNAGEIPGNGRDDDGNGYVDDVHGWNAFASNGNPMDDNGHGTHCAGTIGAVGNNGRGIVGVNWNVKIMALKFLGSTGSGSLSGAIAAINYMVTMKNRGVNVRVANNSWGGGGFSQALFNAVQATDAAGIAFIAAAGNEANDNDARASYPATYNLRNVVSVAAIDRDGNLATFSNYGVNTVDIAAPGVQILSTWPGNYYNTISGTSMATPHVSGAMALLLASEPQLSVYDAIGRLYATGRNLSSLSGLTATGRTLNVAGMLHNQASPAPAPTPAPLPCTYRAEKIGFNPDVAADSAPTVMNADEYNYYPVELQFSFMYFGEYISRLIVSPNGVAYSKTAPGGMDYENSRSAPLNSIAALHTDLYTVDQPYGVKILNNPDRVTILWHAQNYAKRNLGDIKAYLTIYADGTIEDHVSIGNASLLKYISSSATIGMTGQSADKSTTFAYNDSDLKSNTGVRYVQSCNAGQVGAAEVKKIVLSGSKKSKRSKSGSNVSPGKSVNISLVGTGVGDVALTAAFNGKACPVTAVVGFNNGAMISAKMPRVSREFSKLRIRSGSANKNLKINHYNAGRFDKRSSKKKISSSKLSKYCMSFFQSMKAK